MRAKVDNATAATFSASPLTHRVMTLAVFCTAILAACNDGVIVSAFSPPCRASSRPPATAFIHGSVNGRVNSASWQSRKTTTRLPYKHLDNGDDDDSIRDAYNDDANKNATALGRDVNVRVDVNVEIKKGNNVIYYNDLDVVEFSSGSYKNYNVSFTSSDDQSTTDSSDNNEYGNGGLVHELEDAIKTKNINMAIEPSKTKPAKKFVSPIQLIKKVPKVEPIHMSTVFFLKLIGDPMWPSSTSDKDGPPTENKSKSDETKKKPVIGSWKANTNYLESLSANADTKNDSGESSKKGIADDDLLKSLRNQQANLNNAKLQTTQQAFIEANRRTNPQEAWRKRMEEEQSKRKKKEADKLEKEREKLERSAKAKGGQPTAEETKKKKKPVIENWMTKMQQRNSTAFQATNYLESLSANNNADATKNDSDDASNKKKDDLRRALRDQQANLRNEQLRATQQAFIEANRRTNPKEAMQRRMENQAELKKKERENLERLWNTTISK